MSGPQCTLGGMVLSGGPESASPPAVAPTDLRQLADHGASPRSFQGGAGPLAALDTGPGSAGTVLMVAGYTGSKEDFAPLLAPLSELTDLPRQDAPTGAIVEIPVIYDGPDLEVVARACGLSIEHVVAAHTSIPWNVAFGGFAPGFAYLCDGDPRLLVPRRDQPRTLVPAGAVALADGFSAVYPRSSPGGWQVIGRTKTPVWDDKRHQPALLRPGMRVVFQAMP